MTETPEQIMARAIFLGHFHESDRTDDNFTKYKEEWNESWLQSCLQAEAAIAALKEAGMVIVPVEPTNEMSVAMIKAHQPSDWTYEGIYRAAIKAGKQ